MFTVTKCFTFDAAHRLYHHTGKCHNIHGHTYSAEVSIEGKLNEEGMVLDFSEISRVVGSWIDQYWDHAILLNQKDGLTEDISSRGLKGYLFNGDPTAEAMAKELYLVLSPLLEASGKPCSVARVRIYETATCWCDYVSDK